MTAIWTRSPRPHRLSTTTGFRERHVAEERVQRRLAAILVADVVGYSRLIEADEEGTRARLTVLHNEII